jgi:hypothetical protein
MVCDSVTYSSSNSMRNGESNISDTVSTDQRKCLLVHKQSLSLAVELS